jgi:predicted metal-dependent hydrolase
MEADPHKPHGKNLAVLKTQLLMDGRKRRIAAHIVHDSHGALGQVQVPAAHSRAAEDQLAFPFVRRPAAGQSRRGLRPESAARLAVAAAERPVEEVQLECTLAAQLPPGRILRVKLTDNRYTMVTVRRGSTAYTVRVHRMFARAEAHLVRALARYVVHNDARASAVIGEFIEKHAHTIPRRPKQARRVVMRTSGRAHDLQTIFERLNAKYFAGQLNARITWGAAPRRRRPRRSIKMGSFAVEDRIIRIHPVLDHPSVPEYFVAWIVFHEMLHGKHAVVRKGDRRCFHSKEFMAEERSFGDYQRAAAWERANMDRLLGS